MCLSTRSFFFFFFSLHSLPFYRTEIRQKNLFSVADVRLHWHPEGTYLAVRVDQHTKTKKSTYTTFQMFR